jgi:hypothetical protein
MERFNASQTVRRNSTISSVLIIAVEAFPRPSKFSIPAVDAWISEEDYIGLATRPINGQETAVGFAARDTQAAKGATNVVILPVNVSPIFWLIERREVDDFKVT